MAGREGTKARKVVSRRLEDAEGRAIRHEGAKGRFSLRFLYSKGPETLPFRALQYAFGNSTDPSVSGSPCRRESLNEPRVSRPCRFLVRRYQVKYPVKGLPKKRIRPMTST